MTSSNTAKTSFKVVGLLYCNAQRFLYVIEQFVLTSGASLPYLFCIKVL